MSYEARLYGAIKMKCTQSSPLDVGSSIVIVEPLDESIAEAAKLYDEQAVLARPLISRLSATPTCITCRRMSW